MALLPKCKGEGHIKVVPYAGSSHAFGPGETLAEYDPHMDCRKTADNGPGVLLASPGQLRKDRGIHVQLTMAQKLPGMLRFAATTAESMGHDVAIMHTESQDFTVWRVLTVTGAFDVAQRIDKVMS